MSDYILYHHGVKGMKWGIRRFQRKDGTRTPAGKKKLQEEYDNSASKRNDGKSSKKKSTAKKAVIAGAAVVGTALAAYGTYKLSKYIQGKRSQQAMQKASDYVSKNFLHKIGESNFSNGQTISNFANKTGTSMVVKGRGNRDIGKYNARVVSTGKQIYKDATNTRLDRGLNKVVGAGDAVGNAAKRAGSATANAVKRAGSATANTAKRAGTTAKNRVLDVVNPIYEYTPTNSKSTTRKIGDLTVTEGVTDYVKRKIRR